MKGEESKEKDACCENPSLLISMATGVCKWFLIGRAILSNLQVYVQTVTNNPDALTGQGGNSHVPYEKTYIVHVTSIEYWLPVKNQP